MQPDVGISSVCLRTLKRFNSCWVKPALRKHLHKHRGLPLSHQQLGAEGQRAKKGDLGPFAELSPPGGDRSPRLSEEELKFPGEGQAEVQQWCERRTVGHRGAQRVCKAALTTSPVHGQEKSKGGGFTGLPAQVKRLFPGLGYRLPLSSLHLPDPSSSSSPGTSHPAA